MNKSLNVFLSVLLCVILCVGVLTSLYTTDESNTWQSGQVHTSSASAGAPSVSFGVGANGDVLAVPMSSRGSSREQYLQPSWRSTGEADLQGFARSANSTGMLSHPSLQRGDGSRLLTHMSSSQTMKSFGGGSNTGGVSMSSGVVSTNSLSPITNSQLSILSLPAPIFASQQMLADAPTMATYDDVSAPRGIAGRRDLPSIGADYVSILTVICGGVPDYTLTDDVLCTKWLVYYSSPGSAPTGWEQFLSWYQTVRTSPSTPIGGVLPLLFMALMFLIGKLLLCMKVVK